MTRLPVAAMVLLVSACAPRKTISPSADSSVDASVSARPAVTLERTACFGGCPVYSVLVSPSGQVSYHGKAHVRRVGTATGQIPAKQVETLVAELEKAGYFELSDRYTSTDPACGRYATDLPSVITTARIGGRTKRVEHDYGCRGAPGALVILERRIDEVLNSSQWTGR